MLRALLLPFVLMFGLRFLWFIFIPPKRTQELSESEKILAVRLRWAGMLTLAAGLLAAIVADWKMKSAPEQNDDIIGYDLAGGTSSPIKASQSKRIADQAERMSGKFGVATGEFAAWFENRWRGKNLAMTLVVLSVGGFLGFFYLARHFTSDRPAEPAYSDRA